MDPKDGSSTTPVWAEEFPVNAGRGCVRPAAPVHEVPRSHQLRHGGGEWMDLAESGNRRDAHRMAAGGHRACVGDRSRDGSVFLISHRYRTRAFSFGAPTASSPLSARSAPISRVPCITPPIATGSSARATKGIFPRRMAASSRGLHPVHCPRCTSNSVVTNWWRSGSRCTERVNERMVEPGAPPSPCGD